MGVGVEVGVGVGVGIGVGVRVGVGVVMGGSRRARAPQFLEQHREVRAIFIGWVEKAAVILPW